MNKKGSPLIRLTAVIVAALAILAGSLLFMRLANTPKAPQLEEAIYDYDGFWVNVGVLEASNIMVDSAAGQFGFEVYGKRFIVDESLPMQLASSLNGEIEKYEVDGSTTQYSDNLHRVTCTVTNGRITFMKLQNVAIFLPNDQNLGVVQLPTDKQKVTQLFGQPRSIQYRPRSN